MSKELKSNYVKIYTSIDQLIPISKGYFTLFNPDIDKLNLIGKEIIFSFFIPANFIEKDQLLRPTKIFITQSVIHEVTTSDINENIVAVTYFFKS